MSPAPTVMIRSPGEGGGAHCLRHFYRAWTVDRAGDAPGKASLDEMPMSFCFARGVNFRRMSTSGSLSSRTNSSRAPLCAYRCAAGRRRRCAGRAAPSPSSAGRAARRDGGRSRRKRPRAVIAALFSRKRRPAPVKVAGRAPRLRRDAEDVGGARRGERVHHIVLAADLEGDVGYFLPHTMTSNEGRPLVDKVFRVAVRPRCAR